MITKSTRNKHIHTGTNTRSFVRSLVGTLTQAHSHQRMKTKSFGDAFRLTQSIPWALKIKWKVVRTATFQRVFNCSLSLLFMSVCEYSILNSQRYFFRFVLFSSFRFFCMLFGFYSLVRRFRRSKSFRSWINSVIIHGFGHFLLLIGEPWMIKVTTFSCLLRYPFAISLPSLPSAV